MLFVAKVIALMLWKSAVAQAIKATIQSRRCSGAIISSAADFDTVCVRRRYVVFNGGISVPAIALGVCFCRRTSTIEAPASAPRAPPASSSESSNCARSCHH